MNRRTLMAAGAAAALTLSGAACAHASADDAQAPFDSDRIQVSAEGRGPDVILIPGNSSHPEIWDDIARRLTPTHRVHRVHVRGFAGLDAGANAEGPFIEPVAHAIAEYMAAENLQGAAVIGHSLGGSLAMTVASHHPELVGRLMIVDMVPFNGVWFAPPGATAASVVPIADATAARLAGMTPEQWAAAASQAVASMVTDEAKRALPTRHAAQTDNRVAARAMRDLIATDLRPDLARLTIPVTVLYVHGPNIPLDGSIIDAVFAQQYAVLPSAQLKFIPDSRHFIMLDQPEVFASEVNAFLE